MDSLIFWPHLDLPLKWFTSSSILINPLTDPFFSSQIESYREAVLLSLETTFSAPMEEFVKLETKAVRKLKSVCPTSSLFPSLSYSLLTFFRMSLSSRNRTKPISLNFSHSKAQLTTKCSKRSVFTSLLHLLLFLSHFPHLRETELAAMKKELELCRYDLVSYPSSLTLLLIHPSLCLPLLLLSSSSIDLNRFLSSIL
jgi:hypothetical protein